jgi:hypothetical protein
MGKTSMDVLERVNSLEGLRLGAAEKAAFTDLMNRLPEGWRESHLEKDEVSFVIQLDAALDAIFRV